MSLQATSGAAEDNVRSHPCGSKFVQSQDRAGNWPAPLTLATARHWRAAGSSKRPPIQVRALRAGDRASAFVLVGSDLGI